MDLTDEQVEAWKRALEMAGVDLDALGGMFAENRQSIDYRVHGI